MWDKDDLQVLCMHVFLTVQEAAKSDADGRGPESSSEEGILLAACGANEMLPQNPDLPADVFTSCLTTPIKVPKSLV